jgi:hypothetical protein
MLSIRKEQMRVFEKPVSEAFIARMVVHLRENFAGRVPASDEILRDSVVRWIEDARGWGLSSERHVVSYLESCAMTQGQVEPLETRLTTYLRLNYEDLLRGVDVQDFVKVSLDFARQHGVREEEGITWLTVILLAGREHLDADGDWIRTILKRTDESEEARLHHIHKGAVVRGWISKEEVA